MSVRPSISLVYLTDRLPVRLELLNVHSYVHPCDQTVWPSVRPFRAFDCPFLRPSMWSDCLTVSLSNYIVFVVYVDYYILANKLSNSNQSVSPSILFAKGKHGINMNVWLLLYHQFKQKIRVLYSFLTNTALYVVEHYSPRALFVVAWLYHILAHISNGSGNGKSVNTARPLFPFFFQKQQGDDYNRRINKLFSLYIQRNKKIPYVLYIRWNALLNYFNNSVIRIIA